MVSVDNMLFCILSVSAEVLEMSCDVADEALARQACDGKGDNLLSPLHLMCNFRHRNLSRI